MCAIKNEIVIHTLVPNERFASKIFSKVYLIAIIIDYLDIAIISIFCLFILLLIVFEYSSQFKIENNLIQ